MRKNCLQIVSVLLLSLFIFISGARQSFFSITEETSLSSDYGKRHFSHIHAAKAGTNLSGRSNPDRFKSKSGYGGNGDMDLLALIHPDNLVLQYSIPVVALKQKHQRSFTSLYLFHRKLRI